MDPTTLDFIRQAAGGMRRPIAPVKANEFTQVGFGLPSEYLTRESIRERAATKGGDGQPIGLGAALGPALDDLRFKANCPLLSMPTVIEVNWLLEGPQTDANISASFGGEIDPFHSGKAPLINGVVETNLAIPGETQTHFIACGIGVHLEPEPFSCVIDGNSWTHPATAGTVQPLSPDIFTVQDLAVQALGSGITTGFQPAILDWGRWANYVAWLMVQSYDVRWMIGTNCNVLLDSLRNTVYMPPAVQTGSASSSLVSVDDLVSRTNVYYDSLASAQNFLKVNAVRLGSVLSGASNVGIFRPSRDHERVEMTAGGIGASGLLLGSTEFRPLSMPYIIRAGVPVGLKLMQSQSTAAANAMRQYLSITHSTGVTPPTFVDDVNIAAGASPTIVAGSTALERTLDGFNVAQQTLAQRAYYKGGRFSIRIKVKGFEINEDLYTLMATDASIRDAICSDCGVRFAQLGS